MFCMVSLKMFIWKLLAHQLLSFQKAIFLCSDGSTYWIQVPMHTLYMLSHIELWFIGSLIGKTRLSFANSYLVNINKNAEAHPCAGYYYAACCGIPSLGNQCWSHRQWCQDSHQPEPAEKKFWFQFGNQILASTLARGGSPSRWENSRIQFQKNLLW